MIELYLVIFAISLRLKVFSTEQSPMRFLIHSSYPIRVYRRSMAARGTKNRATRINMAYALRRAASLHDSRQHTWYKL